VSTGKGTTAGFVSSESEQPEKQTSAKNTARPERRSFIIGCSLGLQIWEGIEKFTWNLRFKNIGDP
jgi:hypothetical protein